MCSSAKSLAFTLMLCGLIISACVHHKSYRPTESTLVTRVDKYYSNLKAKRYAKCIEFFGEPYRSYEKERLKEIEQHPMEIVAADIDSLQLAGSKATVTMRIKIDERGKIHEGLIIDTWKYIDNDWFLIDYGKAPPGRAVQEFRYPEDYKKQ